MLKQALAEPQSLPVVELVDGFVRGRVSVILPAFNESENISKTIQKVKEQFGAACEDFEIIVVDDGSNDGTSSIVENTTEGDVKLFRHPKNQGKGFAIKKGLYQATGEFAFAIDSDLEIWPKDLSAYLTEVKSADIVIGSKRHPLSTVRTPFMRRFLSVGFNILERVLTGVRASDTQAGLKAGRSAALYKILPVLSVKRYAFDAELLAVATLQGFKIKELPVDIDLRVSFSATEVLRMVIDLLGIAYRLRVKKWYQRNLLVMKSTIRPLIAP